ncbi:MAG TPA: Fur family transcriptional regulator [Capillimicrobium sp.]|nr:Fur family transcriptional regulator [Capillimicrobium sp.]
MSSEWIEHAEARLAEAGYRRGGARRAVIELLADGHCAMTAAEIEERLRRSGRTVGRASVYRTLEQLDALHLVTRLDVGQGIARYEAALPSGDHHHHLVCDNCGKVEPFEDPELERTIERIARRVPRFRVGEHDVVLHGECARCAG